jgi:hypothetical protein
MIVTRRKGLAALAAGGLVMAALAGANAAGASDHPSLTGVTEANPKAPGLSSPNRLSPELAQITRAQGSNTVENPQDGVGYYGYDSIDNNPPLLPVVGATGASLAEAHKTEPDKNTYLVLRHQRGPDASYDYGSHFLVQGHEAGTPGYVSRINLDADSEHRVTILATRDSNGNALPDFDGSTWNPFAKRLLMTAEIPCAPGGGGGGVWAGDAAYTQGARFAELPALGKGGYEGIQTAPDGSIWIVEDVGGATPAGTNARLPNSYIFRFVPAHKGDLSTGTLQALQVLRSTGEPMDTGTNLLSQDIKDLHVLGSSFATRWVTLHQTTEANKAETFCASAAAKTAKATPLKRPENGQFRPGTHFGEFFFTETGDTNSTSIANADAGGWGGIFRLRQDGPSASTGRLNLFALGDQAHTAFDNIAFATADDLLVVEDAGDGLHNQRNALDSGYLYDTRKATAAGKTPVRFLAEGRDASATIDSSLSDAKVPGFVNDGDNEITGIHVSDGDPTPAGLLGAKTPRPFSKGWRVFWTAQHGDNATLEIIPNPSFGSFSRGDDKRGSHRRNHG